MSTANSKLCERLEWDSTFFSRNVGCILPAKVSAEEISQALNWAARHQIDCLYFLCETDNPGSIALAEEHGFRLVGVRVTLQKRMDDGPLHSEPAADSQVRTAEPGDIPTLTRIAGVSHGDSRFYRDLRFERERCQALYEEWIRKSCCGWADRVFVVQEDGKSVGYISCHLDKASADGRIGLLGVDSKLQRQGLGRKLVSEALRFFGRRGVKRVSVVTQGSNVTAQRLYQRCGFVTHQVQLWYHWWNPITAASANVPK